MSSERWNAERYQAGHSYVWRYGEALIDLLEPCAGERIVDLGCGSGQLTALIAERGAGVIGIDSSSEMIAAARANFPAIEFRVADATSFAIEDSVDAVFSNAALHWVRDAASAIASVHRALRPGGRFVFEMGGAGNTGELIKTIREVAGEIDMPWFFPSIGQYAALLEASGFEVLQAQLFDRPTLFEGEHGLEDWLIMWGDFLFGKRSEPEKAEIRREVAGRMRRSSYRGGGWIVDYRRLRMAAVTR
ncbi:MAG TPA: methyltransferase domain-containing protein [Bryobacteraceae bacterium]|nr:methyltransferase domain-containing protein [Bryobacteraceae bacterium]